MEELDPGSLKDRMDIIEVLSRYAHGIDRRDPILYRSCFADVVDVETSGTSIEQGSADDWAALALRAVGIFEVTQHTITDHLVTLAGDEATCVANLQALHWNPDGSLLVGGYYTNRLVRTDAGWKISRLEMSVTWTKQG
jgi:hypothetical protein